MFLEAGSLQIWKLNFSADDYGEMSCLDCLVTVWMHIYTVALSCGRKRRTIRVVSISVLASSYLESERVRCLALVWMCGLINRVIGLVFSVLVEISSVSALSLKESAIFGESASIQKDAYVGRFSSSWNR